MTRWAHWWQVSGGLGRSSRWATATAVRSESGLSKRRRCLRRRSPRRPEDASSHCSSSTHRLRLRRLAMTFRPPDQMVPSGHLMEFVKMQGAGNDFVLVDGLDGSEADWPKLARRMSDRHFGAGADGLLLVRPSDRADFRMQMWNPDGSESEMCGNGIRCFARYLLDGPARGRETVRIETGAGLVTVRACGSTGWLQASMGQPILNGRDIPVQIDANPVIDLAVPELSISVTCVSMGNPHAVQFVDNVAS